MLMSSSSVCARATTLVAQITLLRNKNPLAVEQEAISGTPRCCSVPRGQLLQEVTGDQVHSHGRPDVIVENEG